MLPISLRPNGRRAVIVGGGSVAARKAESLVSAGFPIFVVSERIGEALRALVRGRRRLVCRARATHRATSTMPRWSSQRPTTPRPTPASSPTLARRTRWSATRPIPTAATSRCRRRGARAISTISRRLGRSLSGVRAPGRLANSPRTSTRRRRRRRRSRANARLRQGGVPSRRARSDSSSARGAAGRTSSRACRAPKLVCATRDSALAMVQTRSVAARLAKRGVATTMLGVTTSGDRDRTRPLDRFDDVNVFVKELENALRERRADYAVHSCKDLAGDAARRHANRRDLGARRRARRVLQRTLRVARVASGRRRRRHVEPAAASAAGGAAPGPSLREPARQRRHASAQAGARRVRRHRSGDGRIATTGRCAPHTWRRSPRTTRAGRRPRRAGGRSTHRRRRSCRASARRGQRSRRASSASFASALRCARCAPAAARRSASTLGWTARRCASTRSTRPIPRRRAESGSNARSRRSKKPRLWESPLRQRSSRPR